MNEAAKLDSAHIAGQLDDHQLDDRYRHRLCKRNWIVEPD